MASNHNYGLCVCNRYQTTVKVNKSIQGASVDNDVGKPNHVLKEVTSDFWNHKKHHRSCNLHTFAFHVHHFQAAPSRTESKDTHLDYLMRRNAERERSRAKTNLTRSTSVGSLKSSTGSIEALRVLFESTAPTRNNGRSSLRDYSDYTADVSKMNGEAEGETCAAEVCAYSDDVAKAHVKDNHVTREVKTTTLLIRDIYRLCKCQMHQAEVSFCFGFLSTCLHLYANYHPSNTSSPASGLMNAGVVLNSLSFIEQHIFQRVLNSCIKSIIHNKFTQQSWCFIVYLHRQ